MSRLVHDVAMAAMLLVLGAGLWRQDSTISVLQRMLIAYICFFVLGAVLTLLVRIVGQRTVARNVQNETRSTERHTRKVGT